MVGMSDHEKIGYLLCVIRNTDAKIPWKAIGEELELKPDTASKRLVYIRQAYEKGEGEGEGTGSAKAHPKKAAAKKNARAKAATGRPAKKQKGTNGKAVEVDAGDDELDEEDGGEVKANTGSKRARAASKSVTPTPTDPDLTEEELYI